MSSRILVFLKHVDSADSQASTVTQMWVVAARLKNNITNVTQQAITEGTPFVTVSIEVPVAPSSWTMPPLFTDFVMTSGSTLLTERSPGIRLKGIRLKGIRLTGLPELPS